MAPRSTERERHHFLMYIYNMHNMHITFKYLSGSSSKDGGVYPARRSASPNESDPEPVPERRSRAPSRGPSVNDLPLEEEPNMLCFSPAIISIPTHINKKFLLAFHSLFSYYYSTSDCIKDDKKKDNEKNPIPFPAVHFKFEWETKRFILFPLRREREKKVQTHADNGNGIPNKMSRLFTQHKCSYSRVRFH